VASIVLFVVLPLVGVIVSLTASFVVVVMIGIIVGLLLLLVVAPLLGLILSPFGVSVRHDGHSEKKK